MFKLLIGLILVCPLMASAQHLDLTVKAIPHSAQRYDTVGDYYQKGTRTHFRISKLPDWRYEFLIALHEQIEWALCQEAGITNAMIDEFDMHWKPHHGIAEPGDDPESPYFFQHRIATQHEKAMAEQLGVDWRKYSRAINKL
jgi:hypothetical protein